MYKAKEILRPRMGFVVDAFEFVGGQVGVNLGGGQVDMAEQFLHRT